MRKLLTVLVLLLVAINLDVLPIASTARGTPRGSFGEERAQRVPIVVYAAVEEDSVNESLIPVLRFLHR